MSQHSYGIDIGTSNFKIYNLSDNSFLNEKNIIVTKKKRGVSSLVEFGNEAYDMFEKAPENLNIIFPVKHGVIGDINNMYDLFEKLFKKLNPKKSYLGGAKFCVAVPTDITEVEKRAFFDLIAESGVRARIIKVVEKPIADAVGLDLDVESPKGKFIINFGAATTEISVISSGGIVVSKLLKVGGADLDNAICKTVKEKYNLIIGIKTAELLKIKIADAMNELQDNYTVYGRNLVSGLPTREEISSSLVYESIINILKQVVDSAKTILERIPPEMSVHINEAGVYVTGGSANIHNLDKFISNETGLIVNIPSRPDLTVIKGVARIMAKEQFAKLMYTPTEKTYL